MYTETDSMQEKNQCLTNPELQRGNMDPNVKKILFTTDLTGSAREVFRHAVILARCFGASITMLHVIEDIPPIKKSLLREELGEEAYSKMEQEKLTSVTNTMIGKQKEAPMIEHVLRKLSEDATKDSGSNTPVVVDKLLVSIGRIDDEILYHADANNCDLIVMANRLSSATPEKPLAGTVGGVVRRSKKQIYLVPVID
ncbi:MAG: universal stress protein [SAR324 cluster bacterium]|nr:universal stress protein [SAR324 cluster bacterium]